MENAVNAAAPEVRPVSRCGWKFIEQACVFYTVNGKTDGTTESMSLNVTPDAPLLFL